MCVLCVADNMTAICFTEGWQETVVNNVCECERVIYPYLLCS